MKLSREVQTPISLSAKLFLAGLLLVTLAISFVAGNIVVTLAGMLGLL